MATIAVVTSVPDEPDMGNLALAQVWVETEQPDQSNGWRGRYESALGLMGPAAIALRCAVFARGEILILDESGREVAGQGRRPAKWGVTIQECPTLEDAIVLSQGLDD